MNIYDIEVTTIDNEITRLSTFQNMVLLIVNVASKCVLTRQYAQLELLYQAHKNEGFSILGFPCNQFGNQEPGTEDSIKQFCSLKYQVSFPMFAKVAVNGEEAHPLYKILKEQRPGFLGTRSIKWNFTKFLVDRDGRVVRRFGPSCGRRRLENHIAPLLTKSPSPFIPN